MKNISILIGLTIFLGNSDAFCQELCYENIPLAHVINILDTGDEVWMVTRGDGAFRYDKLSAEVEQFTAGSAGLTTDYLNDLLLYEGQLLLSTDSVVLLYSDGEFEVLLDSIGGAMGISAQGRLIVSSGARYTEWEDNELTYEQSLIDLEGLNFSCGICDASSDITVDQNGTVWISHFGFYEFDVLSYDGEQWTVYDYSTEGLEVFPVESFSYSNQILSYDNAVWASSWSGLCKRENNTWTIYHNYSTVNGVSNLNDTIALPPHAMTVDMQGDLWMGSQGSSWFSENSELALLDDNGWHIYEGLPDYNSFECLVPSTTDPDILYAGTSAGLSIIDKNCLTNSLEEDEQALFDIQIDHSSSTLLLSNFQAKAPSSFSIHDTRGALILTETIEGPELQIDISNLKSGHYTISLLSRGDYSSRSFILAE